MLFHYSIVFFCVCRLRTVPARLYTYEALLTVDDPTFRTMAPQEGENKKLGILRCDHHALFVTQICLVMRPFVAGCEGHERRVRHPFLHGGIQHRYILPVGASNGLQRIRRIRVKYFPIHIYI